MTEKPTTAHQKLGPIITTEWYDGPLRTIRLVEFSDGDRMIQVDTMMAEVGEPRTIGYDDNVRDVMVRFDREELVAMIDVIDGKTVTDFFDHEIGETSDDA